MNDRRNGAMTRRAFGALGLGAALGWAGRGRGEALPGVSGREPVGIPHFPTRFHAYVWRNWQLVETGRMAAAAGTTEEQVLRTGKAMGLGEAPVIPGSVRARSAITVIRRNWHLLPYEQLLALLGWTAEKLAFALKEDDFLYIKLGSLKPKCAPVKWAEPDGAVKRREAEMAAVVKEEFLGGNLLGNDALFSFVERLSAPVEAAPRKAGGLRFCSSYFALYGDPLMEPGLDPYPDGYLARLAACGVNGVWLQGLLTKLAATPWENDADAPKRRENLRKLTERAARHGMRVFLYLNEPRTLPVAAFQGKEGWRGVTAGEYATLCTSAEAVREGLREAVAQICRDVPELGGFFTITASENMTNCWSHGLGAKCPRCSKRSAAEVIAGVNACFDEGIKAAGGKQRLIAWDWAWSDAWLEEAVAKLPDGVSTMSVSEWSLPIERGGVKSEVGEYSISAVGPGPRARRNWAAARKRKLPALAKIQAGNTWELSSVPWIPAVANVAQHAANLKAEGVDGIMLGWTLGGHPSPNLEVVEEVMAGGSMQSLARKRYGEAMAEAVVAFWKECSAAFREFPYHIGGVYSAPYQMGPANLLCPKATGYAATMVGLPYDDLRAWRSIYPAEVWAKQLEKVAEGFKAAAERLAKAAGAGVSAGIREEIRFAEAAALHWGSAAAQARYILARDAGSDRLPFVRKEKEAAKRLHALQSEDARIGFEATNQYYYVPLDLVEKVLQCRWLEAGGGF
ncbi:MAG TPA: hypothetical protein VG796_04555 [Verrucomicrobiales bacterium]|nr:hypothetical protein [Verrucomicrobiales bacterium]